MVEFYHRTTWADARRIVRGGFRDRSGVHPAIGPWTGVWLSDHDRAHPAGVRGRALLVIEVALPREILARSETVADHPADRAFLLPAVLLNRHGRIRRIDPVGPRPGWTRPPRRRRAQGIAAGAVRRDGNA